MITDLPAISFSRSEEIGKFIGVDFAAILASFQMMRFDECHVVMDKLFPIARQRWTCSELFQFYAPQKYAGYYSRSFSDRIDAHRIADHDRIFTLGGSSNYWHFLVDHAARLPVLRYFLGAEAPPLLISNAMSADYIWLINSVCAFLEIGPPKLIGTAEEVVKLTNSFVPCTNRLGYRLNFLRHFGRSFDGNPSAPERVFFRRGLVSQRRVANEQELEDRLLRQFGFVGLDCGSMTIEQQIRALSKAKVMVGGHGGALTNVCFAPKGSHLIELYVHHQQPFFKAACDQLGISHQFIAGTATDRVTDATGRHDNADYVANVDATAKAVERVLP